MVYNEVIKKSIYKWRDNNREQYNEYVCSKLVESYAKNPEVFRKKRMDIYYKNKEIAKDPYLNESKVFRNILIPYKK